AFIVDSDRYLLASFTQETLKYVKVGQSAEVALDLYHGQVFEAKVDSIWWANGEGQYLPSDIIPKFSPQDPTMPQGEFAVKLYLDHPSRVGLPIGAKAPRRFIPKKGPGPTFGRSPSACTRGANGCIPYHSDETHCKQF